MDGNHWNRIFLSLLKPSNLQFPMNLNTPYDSSSFEIIYVGVTVVSKKLRKRRVKAIL